MSRLLGASGFVAALIYATTPAIADPISGYVNADGTVAVTSSLYTVAHVRSGTYEIDFATAM